MAQEGAWSRFEDVAMLIEELDNRIHFAILKSLNQECEVDFNALYKTST